MNRRRRSAFTISREKPRRFIQDLAGIDQFNEVAGRKQTATERAIALGHQLRSWHKRSNDTAGRYDSYCSDCNAMVVVCTERPANIPDDIYGHAITQPCTKIGK